MPATLAPKIKSYRLDGDALVAAKTWDEAIHENMEEMATFRASFQRAHDEMLARQMITMKAIWTRIATHLSLDPEATWADNMWMLDVSYLEEHGLALLVKHTPPEAAAAPSVVQPGETRH